MSHINDSLPPSDLTPDHTLDHTSHMSHDHVLQCSKAKSSSVPTDHRSSIHPNSPVYRTWFQRLPHINPPVFKAFKQFNRQDVSWLYQAKFKALHHVNEIFPSRRMPDKVARILCEHRLINVKELIESFEFFQRVRHRIASEHVADLCCGHGMVGVLFALLERKVKHVYLLDLKFPKSSQRMIDVLHEEFPWVKDKIHYVQRSVKNAWQDLPADCNCVAIHACGARSDWSIQTAQRLNASLAVMPCCYTPQVYHGPRALKDHLGTALSVDIARTYDLERLNYQVTWQEIPDIITPMNRILSASPKS
jgi:hypothetical protein